MKEKKEAKSEKKQSWSPHVLILEFAAFPHQIFQPRAGNVGKELEKWGPEKSLRLKSYLDIVFSFSSIFKLIDWFVFDVSAIFV